MRDQSISQYYVPDDKARDDEQHPSYQRALNPNAPGIYIKTLFKETGRSPSPNQYLRVIKALQNYTSSDVELLNMAHKLTP